MLLGLIFALAASVFGIVVDAASGLPLPDAGVHISGTALRTATDSHGAFQFTNVSPGRYRAEVAHTGYQPALSDQFEVAGTPVHLTLTLQRASNGLSVITQTAVKASESLSRAGTFYRTIDAEQLQKTGVYRSADALRLLPGVNNGITGDTGSLSDDVNLDIRGIGTLETEATLDGHPVGFGFPGGYDYDLSPVFSLSNISVTYGSGGSALTGVDAIGGVINFNTLDPTQQPQASVMQGIGNHDTAVTALRATGTRGRLGYAASYGVGSLDGPIHDAYLYQAGAAYDQSATSPAVRDLAVYKDDSAAVTRSGLAKLVYALSAHAGVTLTTFDSSLWEDKTGNGDGDFLNYGPALTLGQNLLATKSPSDHCPSGTFTATNTNGVPNGTGPNGQPDGGFPCQTPQQYAGFNQGYQGAGAAWQSFNLFDQSLALRAGGERSTVQAQVYTDRYAWTWDRTWQLPFLQQPGDTGSWINDRAVETGADVSDELHFNGNDLGAGVSWMNDTYGFFQNARPVSVPATHETAFYVRDAYHPVPRLYAYANAWLKSASATNTSYLDPRLAIVYAAGSNDTLRAAIGKTTTQPSADELGKSFVESLPTGAGGGSPVTCSGLNSIGSAPSSLLAPEKGVDEEFAYAHRFTGDSQIRLSLFNVNVFDKLYGLIDPLTATGTAFIPPAYLAQAQAVVAAKCGAAAAPSLLGVNGTFNVGRMLSRGFTLDGRARISKSLYLDYDWAATSTMLMSAPAQLLQSNLTLIPGDQLPRLPLHTLDASLDKTFAGDIDVRYTLHTVSANNTKALPPYDFSDLAVSKQMTNGEITLAVSNVFDQDANVLGLRYEGVPLSLNGYAAAAAYAPVIGASATERFGLAPRQVFAGYTARI